MSINLMSLVFKCNMPTLKTDKGVTVSDSAAKFVLLALCDHASDEGEGAYPGVKTICRKTNLSTQTVVNALNALRFNGFTRLEGSSKRRTFNYSILATRIVEFQWVVSPNSSHKNDTVLATGMNPSLNLPPKPSKKPSKEAAGKPPRAADFPEVLLIREVTGKYPARDTWELVRQAVCKVSTRLNRDATRDDLQPFWFAWRKEDYKPTSLVWLDEWAATGAIPEKPKGTSGHARHRETDPERAARMAAIIGKYT